VNQWVDPPNWASTPMWREASEKPVSRTYKGLQIRTHFHLLFRRRQKSDWRSAIFGLAAQ